MNAIKYGLLGLYGVIGLLIAFFGIRLPFAETLAKQYYRYAIAGVLAILLIIAVAIGIFIYSFNANNFKTQIVQYVKEHTQRDLVLQGDIKVAFFPKLGLDTGKMTLSQRNSAREFASVNNARLYIAWWPLLLKRLVFDHVEIDGARVNLARFKDGTSNFDDLLIRDEALSPVTFDVDSVHVTNSSLNWQDDIKWQRVAMQDIQIETGRLADSVPSSLKASFHLNSEKAHSDSTIGFKSHLFYDRKEGRYEFADIEGTLEGTVAGFSNLNVNFKGSVDSHPAQGGLLVENIAVMAKGNYGQRSIDAKLDVPKVQFDNGISSGNDFTLDTTLSQFDEKWKVSVRMPAFGTANNMFKAGEAGADFDFNSEGRTLQGKLSGPVSIDFESTPKLLSDALALELSSAHPMLPNGLSAKGTGTLNADWSKQTVNFDFSAKLDESVITGLLVLNDFSHPAWSFELNTNRIDLGSYISAGWFKRYQDDATRIDLGGFRDMKLSGTLHADEIRMGKLEASRIAADIKIEQGALTIAPLTARIFGGLLTGSFSMSAQGAPQITVKQYLKGFQMSALLADTAGSGKLAGKGDAALDFVAEGGSIGSLRKTLNGSVSLALGRGSLAGIDLRAALTEGKDDLGTRNGARIHEARFSERTDFSELKASFDFKDGVSHGNGFEMKTPLIRTAGVGDIAFKSGNIDYKLSATVASALNRRNAGELAEMRGVTVPISVSGPWTAPAITLDFAAATGDIVTKRIAARAAAEQAAARKVTADQAAAASVNRTTPSKKRAAKAVKK